jgi:hypothetical protein
LDAEIGACSSQKQRTLHTRGHPLDWNT